MVYAQQLLINPQLEENLTSSIKYKYIILHFKQIVKNHLMWLLDTIIMIVIKTLIVL